MIDEPERFWSAPFGPEACRGLAEKYERVFEAIEMEPGARRARGLRDVARGWPGSLREAQSVEPELLRQRWAQAREGGRSETRTRCWWHSRGWACLPLWAELHGMLADQLAWRLAHPTRADALNDFLSALTPDGRDRWPDDARALELHGGPRLVPTQAQRWLAVRIGWSLPDLHRCLFTRVGRSCGGSAHEGHSAGSVPGRG